MIRRLHMLVGGAAMAVFLLLGGHAFAQGAQDDPQAPDGPIEILIVQGYVRSIDEHQLTLTAPGAPADLPLLLAPDTRFIQAENDIARSDIHEGQLVRAALVPVGEDFMAVVVELVPEGTGEQPAPDQEQPARPNGDREEAPPRSTL
ncbi:MAG TPA: hypothetical protein VN033_05435 [Vulgatibacter sp.]|nr:hypothetical protein [Vulgatibacter sp.]